MKKRPPESPAGVLDQSGPGRTWVRSLPAVASDRSQRRVVSVAIDIRAVVVVHLQHHLTPTPRLIAIDASSVSATVKRARFAFTPRTSCVSTSRPYRQPGGLVVEDDPDPWLCVPVSRRVCPGRVRRWKDVRLRRSGYAAGTGRPMTRWYLRSTSVRVSSPMHRRQTAPPARST